MKGVFINALLFSGSPQVFPVNKPENPFQTVTSQEISQINPTAHFDFI